MFEKADFDEKWVKYFWFLRVVAFKRTSTNVLVYVEFKGQQKPEKFDPLFRQNWHFQTTKVSIFVILQGLPSGGPFGAD